MVTRQRARRPLWLALYVLLFTLGLFIAGCGASGGGTTTSGQQGTLVVTVEAGPTCPVENVTNPCPPLVIAHRRATIATPSGTVVVTATTDAQGQFIVSLAPGAYVVQVMIVPGLPGLRQSSSGQATITAGQTTSITIELDTGIR